MDLIGLQPADLALSLVTGVALAAAAGFRIFVPLFATALAVHFGLLEPAAGFAWLGEPLAIAALGAAMLVEIGAYYLPGVDHVLDVVAAPLALVAGVVIAASVMADVPDWLRWLAAVVAGGGATAAVHSVTSLARAKSGAFTGGLGNPLVATGELAGAVGVAALALLAPLLALVAVLGAVAYGVRRLRRRRA